MIDKNIFFWWFPKIPIYLYHDSATKQSLVAYELFRGAVMLCMMVNVYEKPPDMSGGFLFHKTNT